MDILDGLLKEVGFEQKTEDEHATKSLRLLTIKWACKLGHTKCRENARDNFLKYYKINKRPM